MKESGTQTNKRRRNGAAPLVRCIAGELVIEHNDFIFSRARLTFHSTHRDSIRCDKIKTLVEIILCGRRQCKCQHPERAAQLENVSNRHCNQLDCSTSCWWHSFNCTLIMCAWSRVPKAPDEQFGGEPEIGSGCWWEFFGSRRSSLK